MESVSAEPPGKPSGSRLASVWPCSAGGLPGSERVRGACWMGGDSGEGKGKGGVKHALWGRLMAEATESGGPEWSCP